MTSTGGSVPLDIMNDNDISFSPPTSYIRVEDVVIHDDMEDHERSDSFYNNLENENFIETHGGKYFAPLAAVANTFFSDVAETENFLTHRKSIRSQSKLNDINVLNFAAFVSNLVMAYLVGIWALDEVGGCVKFWRIWDTHVTLVTPKLWTTIIWAPMYLFEAVFALAQLAPSIRARPIVQEGSGYFSIYANLGQIGWQVFFAFEMFLPSFVFISTTVISLSCLLLSQHLVASSQQNCSRREYWLLQFPFRLHMAWAIVILMVNLAIMAQDQGASEQLELTIAMVVMGILLLVSFLFLASPRKPDFVVPSILLWTFIGIGFQLHSDKGGLTEKFGPIVMSACTNAAFAFAIIVAILVIPKAFLKVYHNNFTIQVLSN